MSFYFISLCVFVHVVMLLSVFDIYFKSPISNNIETVPNNLYAPSKRLALFVGDGLRADYFFNLSSEFSNSPFLRSVIENTGVWGISHTKVPTESRPGHVAIIAGIYEDPSAIFRGWQDYPTVFDSVFNQTKATFSWGSPDILPIFSRDPQQSHIYNEMYSSEEQDFFGANGSSASRLNVWVTEKFESFLFRAKYNQSLWTLLNEKKILFFFHFLGIDIAGHVSKPKSNEYIENIHVTDRCVERIYRRLKSFYNDERTAFIFTSDHGMTDWGSHGDGSRDETETPIVAWGAGLGSPEKGENDSPETWFLNNLKRRDIEQVDIAPLMSILLGISIPVHSIGTLPIHFLDLEGRDLSEALILNTKQLSAQFKLKKHLVQSRLFSIFYKPFEGLSIEIENLEDKNSDTMLRYELYNNSIRYSKMRIQKYLEGIQYYQNYFSNFLKLLISLLIVGWILFLCVVFLYNTKEFSDIKSKIQSNDFHKWSLNVDTLFYILSIITFLLLTSQSFPAQFYVYSYLTVGIWWYVVRHSLFVLRSLNALKINLLKLFATSCMYLIRLMLLVISFHHRLLLTIVSLTLISWALKERLKFISYQREFSLWIFSCMALSSFPVLPTVGVFKNFTLVFFSCFLWLVVAFLLLRHQWKSYKPYYPITIVYQILGLIIVILNITSINASFSLKEGLLRFNQIVSWLLLVYTCFLIKVGMTEIENLLEKFISICLSLSIPFILLSSGHEALFPWILCLHLFSWILLEYYFFCESNPNAPIFPHIGDKLPPGNEMLDSSVFRRAFFFLTYIFLSFFGIGNIASLNSFDPSWVQCFLTVFSPFTMTALIVFKSIIPMFFVTCSLWTLNKLLNTSAEQLFTVVLVFCDIMGLYFFFSVTNKGSWLQIGMSLSHFIIMETLVLLIVCLYGIVNLIFSRNPSILIKTFVNLFIPQFFKIHRD